MDYNSTNPLPALLKYFRSRCGLTQREVADTLSISRSGYANYEEGRTLPSIEQTIKLSELLNHDLLYAYTLSSRYMHSREQDAAALPMVMEDNTYIASLKSGDNAMSMLSNYKALSKGDRRLVDLFVKNLSEKTP